MNHLIAKTKDKNDNYFKVISDKEIFQLPDDLGNPKDYDSNYKLEDDEWFVIEGFSQKSYCIEFLKKNFNSTEYNQISKNNYNKIQFLCSIQNDIYYFQKVTPSQLIEKKFLSLSTAPSIIENKPIIIIKTFPDAIYKKSEDTMFFKNLSAIFTIFKGIDVLYREATQKETEDFLENDFIELKDNYGVNKIKKTNRKRIAIAMDTLKYFNQQDKTKIFQYIKEYCNDLEFNEKKAKFKIGTENELKQLLYGIEQRYYTTPLWNEKRLANSIVKLKST